jgi:O-antigen/teichoic acid export membrane protein
VSGFVIASLCANAVVCLAALAFLVRFGWIKLTAPALLARALIKYALSSHLAYAIAVMAQRLDQALIALILTPAELGLYAVSVAAGGGTALVGGAIELVAFPKVAAARDAAGRAAAAARYARVATVLAVLAAAVLIPILPWLIELFFGAEFRPAADAARILTLAAIPLVLKAALSAALRGAGAPLSVARIETAVLIALAACLVVLLPRYGIEGAAWSAVIAQTLGCALGAARARRELGLGWGGLAVQRSRPSQ